MVKRWIGDKPVVERHRERDYSQMARGRGWPWERDFIDYDPTLDEDPVDWHDHEA